MRGIDKSESPVLAVDLGGTKVVTAIVSRKGQVMTREYYPTLADEGPGSVINRIHAAIDRLLWANGVSVSELHSISVACAGAIDMSQGLVTSSPNLPGWCAIPFRDIMREKYGVNAYLINDAKAAALGECSFGAGRGVNNLVYLTVSTGIGGGIIIDGKLYFGSSGSAGEVGHMTIDVNGPKCNCGNIGCWETLASGTAVAREARRRISGGERSSLTETVQGRIEDITAEKVGAAAQLGDSLALDIIGKAANYLGVGMVNLVNIFNPDVIIVGGGMAKVGDLLLNPAKQIVRERAFLVSAQAVRIVLAQLGDYAGVLGAAVFALQQPSRKDVR